MNFSRTEWWSVVIVWTKAKWIDVLREREKKARLHNPLKRFSKGSSDFFLGKASYEIFFHKKILYTIFEWKKDSQETEQNFFSKKYFYRKKISRRKLKNFFYLQINSCCEKVS